MLFALCVGFVMGLLGSIPIAGPIGALVFARGIEGRYWAAFLVAAGGGLSEAAYAALAFWGLAELLERYAWLVPIGRGISALVLIAVGIVLLRRRIEPPQTAPTTAAPRHLGRNIVLGFSISALNPLLLANWSAAAAMVYSAGVLTKRGGLALPLSLGVWLGIAGWYVLVVWLLRRYRDRFRIETLTVALRITGGVVLVLAVWFAYSFVQWML